jgi:hypothetical protein
MVKKKTNIKDICNYYKQETHWAKEYKKGKQNMWKKEEQGNHGIPKNHSCQCTCWILLMMMHGIWILEYQCTFVVNMNGVRIWKNHSYEI